MSEPIRLPKIMRLKLERAWKYKRMETIWQINVKLVKENVAYREENKDLKAKIERLKVKLQQFQQQ